MEKTNHTPVIYVMLGHPGSGKSFFARQYAQAGRIALIDSERIRYLLFEDPNYSSEEDKVVLNLMDYMADQFLDSGMSIILDGMNSTRARRRELRVKAQKYAAHPLVVWVQSDVNTSFNRAKSRDRRNPDDKYARQLSSVEFESQSAKVKLPQHEDYVVISGKHVFRNQYNAVRQKIGTMNVKPAIVKPKTVSLGGRVDLKRRQPRVR